MAYTTGLEQETTRGEALAAENYINGIAGRQCAGGLEVGTRVVAKRQVAIAILAAAREDFVDLIALAT